MNKLLLAIVCLTATTTFGQIKKKDMLLGGTFGVSFNSDNINPYSQSNTNIDPLFQWSYKDNRTIGFALGFQYYNSSINNSGRQESLALVPSMPGDASRWLLFGSVGGADVSYRDQKDGPTNWSFNLNLFRYYQFGFAFLINKREP